jgi:DNA replication protein DnaC
MKAMREWGELVEKKCIKCGVEFKISKILTSFKMCIKCSDEAEKEQKIKDEQERVERFNQLVNNVSENYVRYLNKVGFEEPMLEEYIESDFNNKLSKCVIAGEKKNSLDGVENMLDNAIYSKVDIVVHGTYGTGKTRIISRLVHRLLMRHPHKANDIKYVNCQIKDPKLHYLGMDRRYSIEEMIDIPLLILDEAEKITHDYFKSVLVERLNNKKRNILIGNFNQRSFKEVYGKHIFSRLARSFWLEVIGKDQRFAS